MAQTSCTICGQPAPRGHRYCEDCDVEARMASERARLTHSGAEVADKAGGGMRLFVAAFIVTAIAATVVGTAGSGGALLSSLPSGDFLSRQSEESAAPAPEPWGEVRYVHRLTHVRADRTTKSAILVKLTAGDSVRVEEPKDDWYAVFPPDAEDFHSGTVMGYVYAPLLKRTPPAR